jgi:hypothetical protein
MICFIGVTGDIRESKVYTQESNPFNRQIFTLLHHVYKNYHYTFFQDVGQYLPADNETYTFGNFSVTSSKYETKSQYFLKKLTVNDFTKVIYIEENKHFWLCFFFKDCANFVF